MAPDSETDRDADQPDDMSALAREVVRELDPGTVIDDKVVLSRRQALGVASGALSLGAIAGWGSEEASAQAAGQVGTDSEPVDVEAHTATVANELVDAAGVSHTGALADASDVTSTSVSGGYELTINGDTYQFNE